MNRALIMTVVSAALLCGAAAPAAAPACPAVIFVSLASDGAIQIDGRSTAPAAVASALSALSPQAKVVKYYRESPDGEPTAAQDARMKPLLDAMMALRLPIGFSSKPDFSDYVDGNGDSHPAIACKV